ncbi:MAG: glycosyltransferase family 2 protein [Thermoanaerobaculia bacterium]
MKPGVPTLDRLPAPPPGRSGWAWTAASKLLPPRRADGSPWPKISIVTGSHNQGEYLEETLRSVLLQGYPNLEYIVIDGGSTDDSPRIIERYAPWLTRWEAQPDRGAAAALNSGFAHATGDILGFLNSDDTYLPGALERAALEVDTQRNRHLVIGRCIFVDAAGRLLGNEHESRAVSHRRLLAVWKGNTIPQPASFWSRAAWLAGGPLAENPETFWFDYDLFCRMTRHYRAHAVDQILATYRLHPRSITMTRQQSALQEVVGISRRYWGAPWTFRHTSLAASLAIHRLNRLGRARAVLRRAVGRRAERRYLSALTLACGAALFAPDLVCRLVVERRQGGGSRRRRGPLEVRPRRRGGTGCESTQPWPDGWVGPRLRFDLEAAGVERCLRIEGAAARALLGAPLGLTVRIDGQAAGTVGIDGDGPFAVEVPLPAKLASGGRRVEIDAAPCFVPDTILGNADQRRLCWLFRDVRLKP